MRESAIRNITLVVTQITNYDKVNDVSAVHCAQYSVLYTVGVAKIFRFTCTLFWSIPTYSRTLLRSFSKK